MSNLAWLICRDPVHIGGADSSSRGNSNPIYRLPDRTPVIPGSSLRGALREHSRYSKEKKYRARVEDWFGSDSGEDDLKPGAIALGWVFPLWFPIHVLGYGTWWVSCPDWLQRYWQLSGIANDFELKEKVYCKNPELVGKTVYLRWLKLRNIELYDEDHHEPLPYADEINPQRCLIVPSECINLLVDMGLIRQPRVNLKSHDELEADLKKDPNSDEAKTLVKNLFAVESLPPGAVFFFAWMVRKFKAKPNTPEWIDDWKSFLKQDHYVGGLWSVGYGRVSIFPIQNNNQNSKS